MINKTQYQDAVKKGNKSLPYLPESKGFSLQTMTPTNLYMETGEAFENLKMVAGVIDTYVAKKLNYKDVPTLYKALAAEQIDAVAMAIYQIEANMGMIMADMTGIGKGRVVASIIRYARLNNFKPIFFTIKPELFSDMYRDLVDIGSGDMYPLIINTDSKATIKFTKPGEDAEDETAGKIVTITKNGVKYKLKNYDNSALKKIIEGETSVPDPYDCVFVTYSNIDDYYSAMELATETKKKFKKTKISAGQYKADYISAIARNNILVLDEPTSHLDLESITKLNESLMEYPGNILFTSSDHQFVQTIANRIIEITPNGIIDKLMTYDEYLTDPEIKQLRKNMYGE
jgi:energy-coupling factor transporter ATP-binding protein EcfA2